MSNSLRKMYEGWDGQWAHPGSSAGIGGSGNFRRAGALGSDLDLDLAEQDVHPFAPGPMNCILGTNLKPPPLPFSKAQVRADLALFEGRYNFMYLDTKGLVTVGIGFMLPDAASAQKFGFVVRTTGAAATAKEIEADFKAVLAQPAGKKASFYKPFTLLDLPDEIIDERLGNEIDEREELLRKNFTGYDTYPAGPRRALLDMVFNLGLGSASKGLLKYKNLKAAAEAGDWKKAAGACERKGPSPERNAWTRERFLEGAP